MSQKKAQILTIGSFDANGKPMGWEFGRTVRLIDGAEGWTLGGYTDTELRAIAEKDEKESGSKKKKKKIPRPEFFKFDAIITGIACKKPAKMLVHKELKILSGDIDTLSSIDKLLESRVEVLIIKRSPDMDQDEFFNHLQKQFLTDETGSDKKEKDAAPDPDPDTDSDPDSGTDNELNLADNDSDEEAPADSESTSDETASIDEPADEPAEGDGDKGNEEEAPADSAADDSVEAAPAAEPETDPDEAAPVDESGDEPEVTGLVCSKCDAPLKTDPDNDKQYICMNDECATVYVNPDADTDEDDFA